MLPKVVLSLTGILFVAVGSVLMFPHDSQGYDIEDFERKIKFKILPEYCAYMQTGPRHNTPKAERYKKLLGNEWQHTHHYCWGLDKIHKAFRNFSVESQYEHWLNSALSEFNYVLKRSSDRFILKPEILTRQGMVLHLLGKDVQATYAFQSAIHLKPDYVLPYLQLSKLYMKKGKVEEAKKILDRGLNHSPGSSALKQALAKLPIETKAQ